MSLSVGAGAAPQIFSEGFSKIAGAGKTDLITYFRNRPIGGGQYFYTFLQPVFRQIDIWRLVDKLSENRAAGCLPHTSGSGNVSEAHVFPVVFLNI